MTHDVACAALVAAAVLVGCGGAARHQPDSSAPDGGSATDGGPIDAGAADAGAADGGAADGGAADGGAADGGAADGGARGPLAAFFVSTGAVALSAVIFDGSASSDPGGGPLTYRWDFGDGEHGGTAHLAHAYAAEGARTTTLTVTNAAGLSSSVSHQVLVAAAGSPGPSVTVAGIVLDAAGPLAGVAVQEAGTAQAVTSDAQGGVTLSLATLVPHTLKLSKVGYADQFQVVKLPSGSTSGFFKVALIAREAAQPLDATAGGDLVGKEGARLTLPAGALIDGAGAAAAGMVQISQTPVNISGHMLATFPGQFAGLKPDGSAGPIASYGTVEYVITSAGQRLQLAPGKTATIELPLYATQRPDGADFALGDATALWSLSETTGGWVQEGEGVVVASAASPSGLALRAQVSHLSWWNSDLFFATPDMPPYTPKPRCFYNPGPEFPPVPTACTLGPKPPNEYQVGAPINRAPIPPGFRRPPNYAVRAAIPARGGVAIFAPSNADLGLYACATIGAVAACGELVVHGAAGVSDEPVITLNPVVQPPCTSTTALVLPASADYVMSGPPGCFSFDAQAGQVLALAIAPPANSTLLGAVGVADPSGNGLGSATFTSQPSAQVIALPTAGTYSIKVSGLYGLPGAYHLTASLDTPTQLAVPSVTAYQIGPPYRQRFSVAAAAGDIIALSVRSPPGNGVIGNVKSLNDGTTSDFPIHDYGALTFTATTARSFSFEVTAEGGGPAFVVALSKPQPLALGAVVTGGLPDTGEVKSYLVSGTAAALISAAVRADVPVTQTQSLPWLRLFDPASRELDPFNGRTPSVGPLALPATDTYRLDVYTVTGNTVSSFTLRAVSVDAPVPVSPSGALTTTSDSIGGVGEHRYYSLNLMAGDEVRLAFHGAALGVNVELFPPMPAQPFYQRTADSSVSFTNLIDDTATTTRHDVADNIVYLAPATGEYIVHIVPQGVPLATATGAFTWTLLLPAPAALPLDTVKSGSLAAPFSFGRHSLVITTAGYYNVTQLFTGPTIASNAYLRDSAGALTAIGAPARLAAGSYSLEVLNYTTTSTTYEVAAASLQPPVAISVGDTKSGAIEVRGDRDYYQFTGTQGQTYTLTSSASNGLVGQIVVYHLDAGGDFTSDALVDRTAPVGTTITHTLPSSGTYLIEIYGTGPKLVSTGTYTIQLN